MVNVMKGVLIECDPAMKQFLLHLDEKVSKEPKTYMYRCQACHKISKQLFSMQR